MTVDSKYVILILLILALFMGATVEISEGSIYIGLILFLITVIIIKRINLTTPTVIKSSKIYFLTGLFILFYDIVSNLSIDSKLGTLDTMAFFLSMSLIFLGVKNYKIRTLAEFGIYISTTFIVLYTIFYNILIEFNIDFIHQFDHYFILLPTVSFINQIGIPAEVVATETVTLGGVHEMTILIGGPCSGLYSMFLLIGIVFGYSQIEKIESKKALKILGFSILIAYVSNLFRVVVLYLTAYRYGLEAMMLVHTHLGWIIFAVVSACIMYLIGLKK